MHFRQLLPDGKERSGFAAADGQMGQIIHAYLDWRLSGDTAWLREYVAARQESVSIRLGPGRLGCQSRRRAGRRAAQHLRRGVLRTQSAVRHLLSGRAARRRRDGARGRRRSVRRGISPPVRIRQQVDRRQPVQRRVITFRKCAAFPKDQIAPVTAQRHGRGRSPRIPQYQVGDGCLVDQLWASIWPTSPASDRWSIPRHIRKTLESIYRYNYKRPLDDHDTVQRTFVLNDEAAMVICDYGKAKRPAIPFPYFAEACDRFRILQPPPS